MGLLNMLVEKYGNVLAGDYMGCPVACDGKRIIFQQKTNYCFTKDDVEKFTVTESNAYGAKITIEFKDGKRSLVNVNTKGVNLIQRILF